MSKVDWSLAPEGATHFLPALSHNHCDVWFKIDGGYAVSAGYDRVSGWANSYTKDCQPSTDMTRLISRKDDDAKPWSGPEDGLPPVGLEVQRMSGRIWVDSKALAHSPCGKFCAYADDHGMNWGGALMFRPTKTPEQVANDKRETAIADMAKVLPGAKIECYTFNADGSVRPYSHIREVLELLVDAGFKREVV